MNHLKPIRTLLLVAGICGLSYVGYQLFFSVESYYTQIVTDGNKIDLGMQGSNEVMVGYEYNQLAYDKKGNDKQLNFYSFLEKELRKEAFLKLNVSKRKGVMSWEEVQYDDIPEKAQKKVK